MSTGLKQEIYDNTWQKQHWKHNVSFLNSNKKKQQQRFHLQEDQMTLLSDTWLIFY